MSVAAAATINMLEVEAGASVKRYLADPHLLIGVEPDSVRKILAKACLDELHRFGRRIAHFTKRKRMSRTRLEEIMRREEFALIPEALKLVGGDGKRDIRSRIQDRALRTQLLQLIDM